MEECCQIDSGRAGEKESGEETCKEICKEICRAINEAASQRRPVPEHEEEKTLKKSLRLPAEDNLIPRKTARINQTTFHPGNPLRLDAVAGAQLADGFT